ncbi:MAG: HepT-like ribonuclease domain-containing protein [Thermodesulfobacteriota bacterium]|jgi:uncharacterized protein with HEPN domain
MSRDSTLFLHDILNSCNHILEFTRNHNFETFIKDEKTSSAVIRKLEIIGEAAKRIPDEIKFKYKDIPWKKMAGMRDNLTHAYFGVDYDLVWQTITNNIPDIIKDVTKILDDRNTN